MTSPRVIDNDRDEITVTLDGKEIRGWSYASEAERRTKMLAAREFCEGWYQASRRAAQPVVKALREAIEFADQDAQALTPVGKAMVDRWRAAIHTDLPNYAGWRSIDTAPEDCRVILAAAASTPPNLSGEQNVSEAVEDATHFLANAEVRYWEDAYVNGVEDGDGRLIPGRIGSIWVAKIEIATGKVCDWPKGTSADIHYKVCDAGEYWLLNEAGEKLAWRSGYVPGAFLCHGDNGFGDYIILKIGPDGQIADYKRPDIVASEWRASPAQEG